MRSRVLYILLLLLITGCGTNRNGERQGELIYAVQNPAESPAPTAVPNTPAPTDTPAPTPATTPQPSPEPPAPESTPSESPAPETPAPTPAPSPNTTDAPDAPAPTPPPLVAPPETAAANPSAPMLSHDTRNWHNARQTNDELRAFSAFYRGGLQHAQAFLTFDLTYESGHTESILDILHAHSVPAAFFLTLPYMENNDDLVARMIADGHVIALLTHNILTELDDDEIAQEIFYPTRFFAETFARGIDPFLRPAGGVYSDHALSQVRNNGLYTVFWSAAQNVWAQAAPQAHPGMVLRFYEIHAANVQALPGALSDIKAAGYTFASLYDLI